MGLISIDPVLRARYAQGAGIYRRIPAAVARPQSINELRAAIDAARASGLSVIPRAAGSAMPGNNVGDGMIVDLTRYDLDHRLIEPDVRQAHVTPALTLVELNAEASPYRLRLPTDPSSGAWATLGGMVSTNAAGPRSVRDGSIRPWVRGIAMHTADGYLDLERGREPDRKHPAMVRWHDTVVPLLQRHASVIRDRYPKVRKNSAGYALDCYLESGDMVDIIVGSEGTLGIITDVGLRLQPIPAHRASLRVAVRSRADLGATIEAIRLHDPATLEFLDASFLRLIADRPLTPENPGLLSAAAGLLLADFEGADKAEMMDRAVAAARAVQRTALDTRVALDAEEIERLWAVRHGASPILAGLTDGRRSLQVIEDGCVPVSQLGAYIEAVEAAAASQRIDAVIFGHAGDGHVHVNLLPNLRESDWKSRVRSVFDCVSSAVIRLGGTPSGEHGAGRLRAGVLEQLYGPDVMQCLRAVKDAFDPGGLFNPGVILSDGSDPLSMLKVGADAVALPDGIDEYLLQIESGARWAESRWDGPGTG